MKKFLLLAICILTLILVGCELNNPPVAPSSDGIGIFSVSATKKVTFSSGNLQYHPRNNKWRFAVSQLDCIGEANSRISSTYNGWIDMFGWSTSRTNYGVSSSTNYTNYSGSFVDWGGNKIGNDAPNTWRTLTYDEWYYLLVSRPNAPFLCGIAQVNGVNGLVFLSDNCMFPQGVIFKPGFHSSEDDEVTYQTFTTEQWAKLEAAGAVFLPAAGYRHGTSVKNVQRYGYYWFSPDYWFDALYNNSSAYYFYFFSGGADLDYNYRSLGQSVRLVKDL